MTLAEAQQWVRANAPAGTTDADAVELTRLLSVSAARRDSEVEFRIYYVAAHYWQIAANTRRINQAEGAAFDSPRATISALMRQQLREDRRLYREGYTIDPAYQATDTMRLEAGI